MLYSCPYPLPHKELITLAHGSGGQLSHKLIQEVFVNTFQSSLLKIMHDAASFTPPLGQLAFTTDSFVIQPLFFPGGNIGSLSVTGTLNDLAMAGAKPLYLSCSFIIEEGIPIKTLEDIALSMQKACRENHVEIIAGDTKVIERMSGQNVLINTTGIGHVLCKSPIGPLSLQEGDLILISGDIGRHGMAVMAYRENLQFASPLISDCASLVPSVMSLIHGDVEIHCMRDLTRGGLATALVEIAESSSHCLTIEEEAIPISSPVDSACELLGIDPLYVACEGRMIIFVAEKDAEKALCLLGQSSAKIIGTVGKKQSFSEVTLTSAFGTTRTLHRLAGEALPRIC
jgi:hydrogenase expression/formation protein HypE